MKRLSTQQKQQTTMKNLIKQLTKVSQVQTKEIRQKIVFQKLLKNKNRVKHETQRDLLLKKKINNNIFKSLFTNKLYQNNNKKIQSLKQKKIQSDAYLKLANFQLKKIQKKKESIARSHKKAKRYFSQNNIKQLFLQKQVKIDPKISEFMKQQLSYYQRDNIIDSVKNRLQSAVVTSRKQMNNMIKKISEPYNKAKLRKSLQSKIQLSEVYEQQTQNKQMTLQRKKSKKSLLQLIKLSSARINNQEQPNQVKKTKKQQYQQFSVQLVINNLKRQLQIQNELKQSIAFGGLKKILYGDRRGKFIQDNTFKTRVKSQYSQHYMKIVKEQEQILNNFNGSLTNKRNLAQKFADILGQLRKNEKKIKSGRKTNRTYSQL